MTEAGPAGSNAAGTQGAVTADRLQDAVEERLRAWEADRVVDRVWAKDGSLWAASGHAPDALAAWMGWLDLPATMSDRVGELTHLRDDILRDGYRRSAVLGMGGSSLAPELFSRVFDLPADHGTELRILDSTHPDAVRGFREWARSARTLFCVSSKSGTTTEPNAYHAAMAEVAPALDFLAITDPGTPLADLARVQEFRGIVEAPPDVGGRYSALTVFGLVPAALHGVDLGGLLERARAMADDCRRPASRNPGLRLGAFMGEAAKARRDKLTILTSPRLAAFGDWAEQLIAESTGKAGTGIVPIVGEPSAPADVYAADRCFVFLSLAAEADPGMSQLAHELRAAGHPVEELVIADPFDVGGEFVRWEMATAAAGIVLGIDPFDQPNVQESKDATKALLAAFAEQGALPSIGAHRGRIRPQRLRRPPGAGRHSRDRRRRGPPAPEPGHRRRLLRDPGLPAQGSGSRGPVAARPAARTRHAGSGHHAGIRAPLPALNRTAAQGRGRRPASSCRSPPTRTRISPSRDGTRPSGR